MACEILLENGQREGDCSGGWLLPQESEGLRSDDCNALSVTTAVGCQVD